MLIGGNLVLKSVVAKIRTQQSCKPLSGLVCSHRLVYEDGCSLREDGTKMVLKGQIAVSNKGRDKEKNGPSRGSKSARFSPIEL